VMARAVDFSHGSVIDLGCGTGDLKAFLDTRFEGVSYLGIEQVPEFVALARERHAHDADASFELGDFGSLLLPRADHVVACGSLSYRSHNPRHLYQAIARMHVAAAQTVVFNVLDEAIFPEHPLLVGHPVAEVLAFCRRLSARVDMVRGRAGDNVTVVMRAG
jgi:trans-aconitate methyltransferase